MEHLTDEQIDQLGFRVKVLDSASEVDHDSRRETEIHLLECETCRTKVETQRLILERLHALRIISSAPRTLNCPPEEVWLEIASGMQLNDGDKYLEHAAACDHCGQILRAEFNPSEEETIAGLQSASPEWQALLATKISASPPPQNRRIWSKGTEEFKFAKFAKRNRLVLAGGLTLLMVLAIWFKVQRTDTSSAQLLIANAYAEKPNLETRIPGMPFEGVSEEKGLGTAMPRMERPALLAAEAKIARELQAHPDDVSWLQASGRANLLEGNKDSAEAAIEALNKALAQSPNDTSILIDLASAHILNGQLIDTKNNDVAKAIQAEEFSKAVVILAPIAKKSQDEIVEYNYAIALEKMGLLNEALKMWQDFLDHHPESTWLAEARKRSENVQREIRSHDGRSEVPLRSLREVANAFRTEDNDAIQEIDNRIEEYQDQAAQTWLPVSISSEQSDGRSKEDAATALDGLSKLLGTRHGDWWLDDLLLEIGQDHPGARRAVALLAASLRGIETADVSGAERKAAEALSLFRQANMKSGEQRARLVLVLANQYGHRNLPCESDAISILNDPASRRFIWISIQAELEVGICASAGDPKALGAVQVALTSARSHRYPILDLRAQGAESVIYSASGDTRKAWSLAAEALHTYWTGSCPRLRGYNILIAMDELNYAHGDWYLEKAILEEAVPMVEGNPRKMMVAVAESRLGRTLIETGDIEEAEANFQKAKSLLDQSPPSNHRDVLTAESDLDFAKVELKRNKMETSLRILARIRSTILRTPDDLLKLDFFETAGTAELLSRHFVESERDLSLGVGIAEHDLRQVDSEEERQRWSRRVDALYRAYVDLKLHTNVEEALVAWEWYKGAPLRRKNVLGRYESNESQLAPVYNERTFSLPSVSSDTALISFANLAGGYAAWVRDQNGVRERTIALNSVDLSFLIASFRQRCSDPKSSIKTLRNDGATLYREIILPIEPWLSGRSRVIFELDGSLRDLPLALLVNPLSGKYLGDEFEVLVSPGFAYSNSSRHLAKITSLSDALIIDAPLASGWAALPEAERESQSVASFFIRPHILSQDTLPKVNLLREIETANLFHFSGHANVTSESAELVTDSSPFLNAGQLDAFRRGRVTLVVLSACSSSQGTSGFFDDDDSMVRRLIGARVPEVVASRWMVDSRSTALLMQSFYRELVLGVSPAQALRSAEQEVRSDPEFSHPYYWAGFSVFGSV